MIAGDLEFLVSSLPNLSFQDTEGSKGQVMGLFDKYYGNPELNPGTIRILDSEAKKYLSKTKFSIFQKINLNTIHQEEFRNSQIKTLSAISRFFFELKSDFKAWRSRNNEPQDKALKEKIENILGDGNPLEKELNLMFYQWNKVEELSIGHFSDFEALITYKIKLLILLRMWSFNKEMGMENFRNITKND